MTTTVQLNLSGDIAGVPGLQTTLAQPGVNAYAVFFDSTGAPHWTTLVDDGVVTATSNITLPDPYKGGKVYVLIQSGTSVDLTTQITQESDINWVNASGTDPNGFKGDFRYDSFELTLSNNSADQGNLTDVNGFGIPMSVSIAGNGTRGYDINGTTVFSDVTGISASGSQSSYTYSDGPLAGQRMVLSPAESVGGPNGGYGAFNASDWNKYVTALESNASNVVISGWFNGAPSGPKGSEVWHNAGFYSYQLSWDAKDPTHFWLSPMAADPQIPGSGSQIQGYIRISIDNLDNSIYSTLGTADVFLNKTDPANGIQPYLSNMNTGTNNQWGEVFTQFLTGFTAGYYGGFGNPHGINPLLPNAATVDLSKTWNWDPTYAFNHDGTNSLTSGFTGSDVPYDKYAELFFEHANSYGSGYSDNLMKAYTAGGPLISLWDSTTNTNVPTISLTLYADDQTQPAGTYTPATIYNYLPPVGGAYAAATQFVGDGLNVTLSFINAAVVLKDGTPITIGFQGTDGMFHTAVMPTLPAGQSIFQLWNVSQNGNDYSLSPTGITKSQGTIVLNQFPVAATGTGGITWTQITVGSKTFNLYATSEEVPGQPGHYQFVNPSDNPGAAQVDGLASITATSGVGVTFTVNFLGTSFGLDPSLLTRVLDESIITNAGNGSFPTPDAPVPGTVSAHLFTQLADPGVQGTTLSSGSLWFGWNGADSGAHNDVSAYTNKVGALDFAVINFTNTHGGPIAGLAPIYGAGDLDGNWMTKMAASSFSSGTTYNATMTEYLSTDPGFKTAIEKPSTPLTFKIELDTLPLHATGDGNALMLDQGGSATTGNWISFDTTHSTLPNATILLYATDANGNLVARDGHSGSGVTLDDAVLAKIGSVADDAGTTLFSGEQSAYLPVGEQLHFAIQSGNNFTEQSPAIHIGGSGALSVKIDGVHGELELNARVDNTLSADATLASAQRQDDQAWVYLTQGSTVNVELAGSAQNINTAHFVRIDVDPSSGGWSVGGVAYGNTDAFRTAVQQHWDAGFSVQNGGGTFHADVDFKATSGTGFYAPVLATQSGDIFVIGNGNVDGHDHIRAYGQNVFGFEDLRADQHSDFDYNDMIMKVTVA
jgi:uncharacterized protein DUF4114